MVLFLLFKTCSCFLGKYECIEDEFSPKQSYICTPDHQEGLTTSNMMRTYPKSKANMEKTAEPIELDLDSESRSQDYEKTVGDIRKEKEPSQKVKSLPKNVADVVDSRTFFGSEAKNYGPGRRAIAAMRSNGKPHKNSLRRNRRPSQTRPDYNEQESEGSFDPNENKPARPDYNDSTETENSQLDSETENIDEDGYQNEYSENHENLKNLHHKNRQNHREAKKNQKSGRNRILNEELDERCADQTDFDDLNPQDFDWTPIVRKVVVPAEPRRICMLKIVPVPVTRDGKLWKPNFE